MPLDRDAVAIILAVSPTRRRLSTTGGLGLLIVVAAFGAALALSPRECSAPAVCVYDVVEEQCRPSSCDVNRQKARQNQAAALAVGLATGGLVIRRGTRQLPEPRPPAEA